MGGSGSFSLGGVDVTLAAIDSPAVRIVKQGPSDLDAVIRRHQQIALQEDFSLDLSLRGRLELVFFERKLKRGETPERGAGCLDWNGQGPRVAFSRDYADLIFQEPIASEMPALPMADSSGSTIRDGEGNAKMKKQPWEKFGPVILEGRHGDGFLVFRPIHQIIVRSCAGVYLDVRCQPSPSGECMALLVDPQNGQAHFVGGNLVIAGKK